MVLFFFNDTATTEIYTLSLHDALPIWVRVLLGHAAVRGPARMADAGGGGRGGGGDGAAAVCDALLQVREVADGARGLDLAVDRKSTRLNSSHANISYAVFCLKKIKKQL